MNRGMADALGSYVYLYIDPRDEKVFYVGKGRGKRALAHQKRNARLSKHPVARELKKLGLTPRVDLLKWGLDDKRAVLVESAAIELLGITGLANRVRGHNSIRAPLNDVVAELKPSEATIRDRVVLINIARDYLPTMSAMEVYDRTRSAWKIKPGKHNPEYALAVFRGIVREVFKIAAWVPGGTTMRGVDKDGRGHKRSGRWEFVGQVADAATCKKYKLKAVSRYLPPGAQNPVRFVNC
jgi:hypothetical protein